MSEALNGALANLDEAIKISGAEVSCEALPSLRVHATQLQQLFQNLIGNAIMGWSPGLRQTVKTLLTVR
jgi:light-regulated signal transduction histidine kinase (bacteriophytochrome)